MSQSKSGKKTNLLPIVLVGLGLMAIIITALVIKPDRDILNNRNAFTIPPIEVDQPAPELTLSDLDGLEVSLSDFHGEVVLLNNWATWCPPCRQEMPEIQAYYHKYKDQGFQVIAVEAGEPEEVVRDFVEQANLDFIILLDPENKSLVTFQHTSLPNSFVIDRRGHLRLAWLGAINLDTLEQYVTPLIKE